MIKLNATYHPTVSRNCTGFTHSRTSPSKWDRTLYTGFFNTPQKSCQRFFVFCCFSVIISQNSCTHHFFFDAFSNVGITNSMPILLRAKYQADFNAPVFSPPIFPRSQTRGGPLPEGRIGAHGRAGLLRLGARGARHRS